MELGAFSVSLAVKDIAASKLFYEKLGFAAFMGDPGWNSGAQPLGEFTDIRELQRQLKESGVDMLAEADESSTGPARFGGRAAAVHGRQPLCGRPS